jgi:DNA-binding transcriptional ArsR family regulator
MASAEDGPEVRAENDVLGLVFKALADPTRRLLLDRLHVDNGQTLGALGHGLAISRQGVTQHLARLEAADLMVTHRHGREKLHYLNPVPLHEIYERWIAKFEQPDLMSLHALKTRLEREDPMVEKPTLVYVTYIVTTPDAL